MGTIGRFVMMVLATAIGAFVGLVAFAFTMILIELIS
jgi:hypothetical protein